MTYKTFPKSELDKLTPFDFSKLFSEIVVPEKLTALKLKGTYYSGHSDILQLQLDTYICKDGMYVFCRKAASSARSYSYVDVHFIVPVDSEDNYTTLEKDIHRYVHLNTSTYGDHGKVFIKWANVENMSEYARKSSALQQATSLIWNEFREKWNEARRERRAALREKISTDPSFANEVKVTGDIEKTQASLSLLKDLGKLRSVIDSIISGVGKNGVSEDTISEYSNLMGSMGSDRRAIVSPLRKHFLKKAKSK